jgi:LysM repeat protein
MRKFALPFLVLALLLLSIIFPLAAQAKLGGRTQAPAEATDLIDAVIALRAANGLFALQSNPVLMQLAQDQADYELSIHSQTATNADGLKPFERALIAGYLISGDLGQGGDFSELRHAGVNILPADAVKYWSSDNTYLDPLLSSVYSEVGAGVATSGNTTYFVLDIAHPTGGTPVAWTPPAYYHTPTPTIEPSTPNPNGSITHIVRAGDTLGSISLAYNISIADLLRLNNMKIGETIYVGEKIVIKGADPATPTEPTGTPTTRPTITPWPTATVTQTNTPLPPTATPAPALPASTAGKTVGVIIGAALVVSALIALLARKRKK